MLAPSMTEAGGVVVRDFKDTLCPFFESDTLFLECCFVLCLVVWRFFESRDVSTVPSNSIVGIPQVERHRRLAFDAAASSSHKCARVDVCAHQIHPRVENV